METDEPNHPLSHLNPGPSDGPSLSKDYWRYE